MAKKSISQKNAERREQENQALKKIFNVFLLGLAAECYLFIVYRGYVLSSVDSMLVWYKVLTAGMWLGLAALLAGVVLGVLKRGEPKLRKLALWAAGIGLFLASSGWIMTRFNPRGVTFMCVLVPVLTLLGLVYFLFQRECFLGTVALAGTFFTVWLCGEGLDSVRWRPLVMIGTLAVAALLAALAFGVRKVQKDKGKLSGSRVFSVDCDYRVLYGVMAVCAICALAALVLPAAAYYLLWALGILLFVELVYYTTKLM